MKMSLKEIGFTALIAVAAVFLYNSFIAPKANLPQA